jgi:hypothetical protein
VYHGRVSGRVAALVRFSRRVAGGLKRRVQGGWRARRVAHGTLAHSESA